MPHNPGTDLLAELVNGRAVTVLGGEEGKVLLIPREVQHVQQVVLRLAQLPGQVGVRAGARAGVELLLQRLDPALELPPLEELDAVILAAVELLARHPLRMLRLLHQVGQLSLLLLLHRLGQRRALEQPLDGARALFGRRKHAAAAAAAVAAAAAAAPHSAPTAFPAVRSTHGVRRPSGTSRNTGRGGGNAAGGTRRPIFG
eukprot:scaffold24214_cov107-Isochrysis_galbana.AAC.4